MKTQAFATLRDLDDLGPPAEALAMQSDRQKRVAIDWASGRLAVKLRKKYKLYLVPDLLEVDTSGLSTGACTVEGTPSLCQDLAVKVVSGGAVAGGACTVAISTDAGATFGEAVTLPASGALVIDGVTLTFSGTLTADDLVSYATGLDHVLRGAVVDMAAWRLLFNRGISALDEKTLQARYDDALALADELATGEGELDQTSDASPEVDEGGPFGDGQENPWDWQDAAAQGQA